MSNDLKRLSIAVLLSTLVLISWQFLYENPRKEKIEKHSDMLRKATLEKQTLQSEKIKYAVEQNEENVELAVGKIIVNSSKIKGSISLRGLRFDDLELKSYHQNLSDNSPFVKLLSNKNREAYFVEFGWIKNPNEEKFSVPDKSSIWNCDHFELNDNKPVHCNWHEGKGVNYFVKIEIDDNYLFTVTQTLENKSDISVSVSNYARIFKSYSEEKRFAVLHEGAIGVFDNLLKESTYEELSKEKQISYNNTAGSWAGITDQYWLTALIPDRKILSKTHFISKDVNSEIGKHDVFNVNYTSQDLIIKSGEHINTVSHLFTGPKDEKLLDNYATKYEISLFDRAIDYGIFYFITKPLLWLINYFYSIMGNFGLAILGVTLALKLLMYPLSYKSYISMNKIKELQPKIEQIKNNYSNDKIKFNQEIMDLYKKEKVSPAAGCLPVLIQIPLFFSLYKVIFIAIEMRHAPFYGWIQDLSAPDPTSMWNLFGLMPWGKLGMIDIGAWPLIMAISMYFQQKLSPQPADPVQANVMKFMPLLLVFMLYSLPSGLMIYWAFSNILSIAQQYFIGKTAGVKNR
jgi:YidC/Oxa1 family membrane protein insertase